MIEDRIAQLIRQADQAADAPPAVSADLADRVRRLAYRRRVGRVGGCAAAAVTALAVGAAAFMASRNDVPVPGDRAVVTDDRQAETDLAQIRAELDRLHADTQALLTLTRQLAERDKQRQRLAELRRTLAQPDPIEETRQQVAKAAFIIVYQADRMYNELGLTDSAIASYRRVVDLFPDTPSADVARQRLAAINMPEGDQL